MADKFRNKYRISSIRLPDYDYSQNGYYFITICTNNREHYFGEMVDDKMQLLEIGKIAQKYWREIPEHFPFVIMDAFIIMPNHIHGIVVVAKHNDRDTAVFPVETQDLASLQKKQHNKFGPQSRNLATINSIDFAWQSRFYDHIIRDCDELDRIREYIRNNPSNWAEDRNNVGKL